MTTPSSAHTSWRPELVTAAKLESMQFEPPVAYIEGFILEGLGILGGKPKLGKSWWALRAALTIATGGVAFGNPHREVTQAKVLYLALEDGHRRLQDRLRKLTAPGEAWPHDLTLVTEWPRLDNGGLDRLAEEIDSGGYKIIIIDTLGRVRVPRRGKDHYQEDSDAISMLHDMTRKRPGIAMLLVHHNRKDDHPDDYIDALSGTTGLSGVVDHVSVLQRIRGEADAVLRFTSRDAPEHDTAFKFEGATWVELGNAATYERSKAREEVRSVLVDLGGEATLTELADVVNKALPTVLELLRGLADEGAAYQDGARGPWKVANSANNLTSEVRELGQLGESPGAGT